MSVLLLIGFLVLQSLSPRPLSQRPLSQRPLSQRELPQLPLPDFGRVETTNIEGFVVRIGDNSPIPNARVVAFVDSEYYSDTTDSMVLRAVAHERSMDYHELFSASTDTSGRFLITGLDPDENYRLVVSANGYVRQQHGQKTFPGEGRRIVPIAGQTLKGIVVAMTPTGSIEGTVRSEDGSALQGVRLRLLRYGFNHEGRRVLETAAVGKTNRRGRYRVHFVTPGSYYLYADRPASESDGIARLPISAMFFPRSENIAGATVIQITPGMNRWEGDFVLPEKLHTIRGRVAGMTGIGFTDVGALSLFRLPLDGMPSEDEDDESAPPSIPPAELYANKGEFEFKDVPTGHYAIVGESRKEGVAAVTRLRVDRDIPNAMVLFESTTVLMGIFRTEGELVFLSEDIVLRPTMGTSDALEEAASARQHFSLESNDGRFAIKDVLPTEYTLDLASSDLPYLSYVKEARFGGVDVMNQPFQVLPLDSRKLEIVLGTDVGDIEGTVLDRSFKPYGGIKVVLVPNSKGRPDLYEVEITDKEGVFRMTDIPVGDYRLFAWEAIEPHAWFDPEVIRRYESRGTAIKVLKSSTQTVLVNAIP